MPTRKRVTSVNLVSVAKVCSLLYAGLGLVGALLFAVAPELAPAPIRRDMLILLPFFNAIIGFLGGLFLGKLYNLIAAAIGGIVIEVADEPAEG